MATQVVLQQINSKACLVISSIILAVVVWMADPASATRAKVHIAAFGDSLTAGYGLPPGADFASRLEAALNRRGHQVRITNAGVSGDTTSGGLARFDWAVPEDTDAVILELGANDALRGISPEIVHGNLDKILAKLSARKIPTLIAGMRAPANWGADYQRKFNAIYSQLAEKYQAGLYPFFLEGIIDKPTLKLPDALHPNVAGVEEIVRRILPSVEDLVARTKTQ